MIHPRAPLANHAFLSMWAALYVRLWAAGLPVLGRGPSTQAGSSPGAEERRGGPRTPSRGGRPMAAFG